jgi:hypothetical protein
MPGYYPKSNPQLSPSATIPYQDFYNANSNLLTTSLNKQSSQHPVPYNTVHSEAGRSVVFAVRLL